MNKFRCLHADEIECRVQQVKDNGLILLLYKDARCDMTILDEAVGAMDWQREHRRDNANCVVSIWDSKKGQWISKEDTGKQTSTARCGSASVAGWGTASRRIKRPDSKSTFMRVSAVTA